IDRKPGTTTVIEQALDGLAALGGERPKDFGLRVGPLVARVNRILAEEPRWGDHYSSDFTFLIANWIEPQRSVAAARGIATPRDWLIGRIREVALMLQRGTRSRLLALPTDDQDW